MTSTELLPRRRLALVLAAHSAEAAAPAGIEPAAFARACLADAYEVLADLAVVRSGIAGPDWTAELLWPGALRLPAAASDRRARGRARRASSTTWSWCPPTSPTCLAWSLAKIFQVLPRVDLAIAPEADGDGCVALGMSLPLADWLAPDLLDLDRSPLDRLRTDRVPRSRWALVPALAPVAHSGRPASARSRAGGLGGDPGACSTGLRPSAGGVMVAWDQGVTLADRFRAGAGTAPHLYGHAMRAMADDWEAGGPVRRVLRRLRGRAAADRRCRFGCWPGCSGWC